MLGQASPHPRAPTLPISLRKLFLDGFWGSCLRRRCAPGAGVSALETVGEDGEGGEARDTGQWLVEDHGASGAGWISGPTGEEGPCASRRREVDEGALFKAFRAVSGAGDTWRVAGDGPGSAAFQEDFQGEGPGAQDGMKAEGSSPQGASE